MIRFDDLVVLVMIAIAAGFLLRRLWRRLHPRADAPAGGGCAGCGGCGGPARRARPCGSPPAERRD